MTTTTIETAPASFHSVSSGALAGRRPDVPVSLDQTTLVAAYGTHRDSAYRLAYRILGDGPAAEDAVQDAYLKLWTGAAQFDPARGSMRGLLLTIARHTSIDAIRKRARRQLVESTYCADATYVSDGPERAIERADEARRVRSALLSLPDEQRSVIEMAYFGDLTCRQIAAEKAIPVGTVKSRLRLAMRKLALTLAAEAMPSARAGHHIDRPAKRAVRVAPRRIAAVARGRQHLLKPGLALHVIPAMIPVLAAAGVAG